jgi:hypothetical protein
MIRCIYCSQAIEAPEGDFPNECPECFTIMNKEDWEWVDAE